MGGYCDIMCEEGINIIMNSGKALFSQSYAKGVLKKQSFLDEMCFTGVKRENTLFGVVVDYVNGINIKEGEEKKIVLHFENHLNKQQWLEIKWYVPLEWQVLQGKKSMFCLDQRHGGTSLGEKEFIIIPSEIKECKYDLILEIKSNGRLSTMLIPVTFTVE